MDSFSLTMDRLRIIVNSRLRPGVSKVWVQAVNGSVARFVFTCFFEDHSRGYEMRFIDVKNFRHFRPDGDLENEMRLLEGYVTQFTRVLDDIIE